MNFFINSPAYYTQENGVIDEIYDFCKTITYSIDVRNYTNAIDTIGITPIIAPRDALEKMWSEEKRVSLPYRMASISLHIDYDTYCSADIEDKKKMILDNIFESLRIIKTKLHKDFDLIRLQNDIMERLYAQGTVP